jgi:dTDP-4-amino-4,6-dideoxygalactose transaminase
MAPEASDEVAKVLNSGFIGQGPKVEEFETALKDRFQTDFLATTNSATSAEHLTFHILKQLGLLFTESEDEVLTTALTCTATNMPIVLNGLKIRWVDIDPKSLTMDLDDLERKITPKTKVVYLTNWGGMPHDMTRISQIVDRFRKQYIRLTIIQDSAHAWGSKLFGKPLSDYGDISTYSFQAIKHFTTVDGGMVVLNKNSPIKTTSFLSKFILQRWYGIDRNQKRNDFRCEADISHAGFKFHMNDVNATVGLANLRYTDGIINSHKDNAKYYDDHLKNIHGLELLERKEGFESSFWIYSLLVEDRTSFMKMMSEKGIMTSQVHERNDKHTCFKAFRSALPALDRTIPRLVHIPVHWDVSHEDRERIVDAIKQGW